MSCVCVVIAKRLRTRLMISLREKKMFTEFLMRR